MALEGKRKRAETATDTVWDTNTQRIVMVPCGFLAKFSKKKFLKSRQKS